MIDNSFLQITGFIETFRASAKFQVLKEALLLDLKRKCTLVLKKFIATNR